MKLLAARFLIENMDVHYSFQSKELDAYYSLLDSISTLNPPDTPSTQEQDSLLLTLSLPNMQDVLLLPDLNTLSADFLIENIEQAFEAWKSPFAKELSFEDFCEYLLPYRVRYEQLTSWRSWYKTIFSTHLQTYTDTILDLESGLLIQDQWTLYSLPEENKCQILPAALFSDISEITVSGWINPDANRTFARFFDFGKDISSYICFIPYDEAEKSSLRFLTEKSPEERITADALPVNRWSHVAVSLTNHSISLYINGQLIDSKEIDIELKNFICNYIGKSQFSVDPYLEGSIEQFEIYSTVLTDEEIKTLASNRQANLSSSHNLLLQTHFKSLPGKTEYQCLGEDLFSGTDQFTVSGWIKPDQNERFSRFFDFGKD
ncbi:MAG: LamG domain-containing protein [Bacteroides sp.]|nr:LamG domain-containing protein [Bacteroides sp.]